MPADVLDSISNRPELIVEAVQALGKSKNRRLVFEAIYYHKKQVKTVQEISDRSGLSRKQVLTNAINLVRSGLATQEKAGGDTAYRQLAFFQHNKSIILKCLDNPKHLKTIVTKRTAPLVMEHPRGKVTKLSSRTPQVRRRMSKKLRIAFLATNPDQTEALRTDIEARNVLRALQSAGKREEVDVRLFPAATATDLVNALNEFAPAIVHFGGHGGDERLLFDDESLEGEGGVDIDFELINKIFSACDAKPRLVVFNACDTLVGAERFLENVEAVVAMASSIGDVAAAHFAGQFYRAIASKQSVGAALNQGKNAIEIAKLDDFELPTPLVRDGLELRKMIFA